MRTGVLCEGGVHSVQVGWASPVHWGLGKTGWGGWLVAGGGSKVAWG